MGPGSRLLRRGSRLARPRSVPLDGVIVPGLLLLIGRDLLTSDRGRVLAWRMLHDQRLTWPTAWLPSLFERIPTELDRDPIALMLGAVVIGWALLYAVAALRGARHVLRAALLAVAAVLVVVLPTAAFTVMGILTERPYGQDGGVVQLPLALEKIRNGESPYGADYSDSILGKEARVSDFWAPLGGNPILRHHAYLPGTHWLMMPAFLLWPDRASFDPRVVTLLALGLATYLATRLPAERDARLAAAALVALNPLAYWHLAFGANDILVLALLLLSAFLAEQRRPGWGSAALGFACATKQLAWPVAPFLLFHLAGFRGPGALRDRALWRRLVRLACVAAAVFVVTVAPLAALDPRAFFKDIVAYNLGLPGVDKYPLGGTPGFGFANLLIYAGSVRHLQDEAPLSWAFVLIVPLTLMLLVWQSRQGTLGRALAAGSAAFLLVLYFSRTVHANYLAVAAVLLPLGFLLGTRRSADIAVVPLLLIACAVEVVDTEALRTLWDEAVAVRLPQHLTGWALRLAPRAGPSLTLDPLGIAWSALAAGLGVVYLVVGLLGATPRFRLGLAWLAGLAVVAVPTLVVVEMGRASGVMRAQDPWIAPVTRLARGDPSVAPREMWSGSFRRDPPRVLGETRAASPGDVGLGLLMKGLGLFDPRIVLLFAWAIAALLAAKLAASEHRPLAMGVVLFLPGLALGTVFGAPSSLLLALLLAVSALARAGRRLGSGLLAGCSAVQSPSVLPAQLFVLARHRATAAGWMAGAALLAAWGTTAGGSLWPAVIDPVGIGLTNLLVPWMGEAALRAAAWILPTMALAAAVIFSRIRIAPSLDVSAKQVGQPTPDLTGAAVFLLLGLYVTAGVGPNLVAAPLGMLVLSALTD